MIYRRTTFPEHELVPLEEIKRELRVDGTEYDEEITRKYQSALEELESDTRRQFVTAEWELSLDCFPRGPILIERCPVTSIDGITYVSSDGTTVTLASSAYRTDLIGEPARIEPVYGTSWPTARKVANAVTVAFTAGYGGPEDCPVLAKQGVLLRTRELYEGCGCSDMLEHLKQRLKWGAGWRS